VTGLPNKRLEKQCVPLRWARPDPVGYQCHADTEWHLEKVLQEYDPQSTLEEGGKWTAKLNAEQEDFWKF